MSSEAKPYPPESPMNPYYIGVGRICMAWAAFELRVNHLIWHLANVEQAIGACITSNFNTPNPRLLTLAALMDQRWIGKDAKKELNKIIADATAVAGQRNRIVHDPAYAGTNPGEFVRLQITADRKLVYDMQPDALGEILSIEKKIRALIKRFEKWRDETMAALPSLPDKQFRQSPGINIGPLPDQGID